MESKLIIFLLFVGLAQGTYVPSLSDNFGLSDEDAAVLEKILVNEEAVVNEFSSGIELIFDAAFDSAEDDHATVSAALVKVKDAISIYFDSDVLVLGDSCSAVEVARNVSYNDLDDILAEIHSALRLARSGNFPEIRAGIESHHAAAEKSFRNSVDSEYSAILTCLATTDAGLLAVTEEARVGSHTSVVQLTNAIFNFIKVLAGTSPVTCGDKALSLDVEEFRDYAIGRIKSKVEYKLSLLRTLYIAYHINEREMIPELSTNQHGLTVAGNKYHVAYDSLYGIVLYYLKRVEFGLKDEGGDDFSRHDSHVAEVMARYSIAGTMTLDAIPLINPEFAAILAALREQLDDMSYEGDMAFLDVVDEILAYQGTDFSELQAIMDHYRDIAISVYEPSNVMIFMFIRNDMIWSDEVDVKLVALQKKANKSSSDASHRFFDAVEILARCLYEGKVSANDYDEIQALKEQTYYEVDTLLQSLFAAGFYVLQESKA